MTQTAQNIDALPSDVSALRIAKVYAEALLKSVAKTGPADAIVEELESLVEMLRGAPQLEAFFLSPAIPAKVKTAALQRAIADKVDPILGNFLMVLNEHGRLDLLRQIARESRHLIEFAARRVRVQVISAAPLPADQQERVAQQVRDALGREPTLVLTVDPDILGGIIFQAGDWKYDGSVRTQLKLIREQIIARSSYEIQSGRDRFSTGL